MGVLETRHDTCCTSRSGCTRDTTLAVPAALGVLETRHLPYQCLSVHQRHDTPPAVPVYFCAPGPDSTTLGYQCLSVCKRRCTTLTNDDVELNVLGCRADILGTNCDQCVSMVQCCCTSTEIIRLVRTGSSGRPPRLSHSS